MTITVGLAPYVLGRLEGRMRDQERSRGLEPEDRCPRELGQESEVP